jgi:hypothetical protein
MAEKNKLKTAKTRGKGGSISYLRHKGGLFYFITFVLIFLVGFQPVAFAARSSAGGGKIAKPDWGKVATNVGISIGAAIVLPALGSGLNAATPTTTATTTLNGVTTTTTSISLTDRIAGVFNFVTNTEITKAGEVIKPWTVTLNSLGQGINLANVVSGYTTFVATSQVNRAVGMAGAYYGWKPSTTFITSSFATGTTAGFLNPSIALGADVGSGSMTQGAFVGGLTGLASGAAITAIDGSKINKGKNPGVVAQVSGLVAGTAAGNFGRELIKPTAYGPILQQKEITEPNFEVLAENAQNWLDCPELTTATDIPLQGRRVIYQLNDVNIDLKAKPFENSTELTGPALAEAKGPDTRLIPIGPDMALSVPKYPHVTTQGLLDATFVKTADMWPQFATRALSIAVTNSLGSENSWASSLVSGVVEGVAGPVISNLAEGYALKPGLYVGGNKLINRVAYVNNILQLASVRDLSKIGDKLYEGYREGKISEEKTGQRFDYSKKYQEIVDEAGYKDIVVVPDVSTFTKFEGVVKLDLDQSLEEGIIDERQYQKALDNFAYNKENYDPARAAMGIAFNRAKVYQETQMKDKLAKEGLGSALAAAGVVNPSTLYWNNSVKEAKFGLVEGAITGGISALASKLSKNDPSAGAVASYGATMLTGAVRGVLWHKNWEENLAAWSNRYALYEPQPYTGDDWWQKKIDDYNYPRESARFNKFGQYSGLQLVPKDRDIVNITASGEISHQYIQTSGYELGFKGKRPDLGEAVLLSMSQANREFLNRAFAFGAPQVKPEYVNTLMLTDYLNNLRGYAISAGQPGGLSSALNQSYINAASQAISTNVLTSLATSAPLAKALNMQQQRLVATNSPLNPYTIQSQDYQPWLLNMETSFYLPFPSDSYRAKSITGKSFYRDR